MRKILTGREAIRLLIAAAVWMAFAVTLASCSGPATPATPAETPGAQSSSATAKPTPSAVETVTPGVTEGPYYKAGSPQRTSLVEAGTTGSVLTIKGRVVNTSGQPVGGARLEFWQADEKGAYDNTTYRYRGHQFTTADGSYQLTTVIPGLYTGRTRHIHVKIIAGGFPELTTQLFFPGDQNNASDSIYQPALLLQNYRASTKAAYGTFEFVLSK